MKIHYRTKDHMRYPNAICGARHSLTLQYTTEMTDEVNCKRCIIVYNSDHYCKVVESRFIRDYDN